MVGDDPGSRSSVAGKHRDCAGIGVASLRRDLPATIAEEDLLRVLDQLNEDPACTGAVVLDVGVSQETGEGGRTLIIGDVEPAVADVAFWLSPNPGGVGPMTRVMLLANVVGAAERRAASRSRETAGVHSGS